MDLAKEQLLQAALQLSPDERDNLIEALIAASESDSSAPLDDEWQRIAQQRSKELDAGLVKEESWEAIQRRVHTRLGLDA